MTTYLTRREIETIREVADLYDLTSAEVDRLINEIDGMVCNRLHEAYYRAHAGAAVIERQRPKPPSPSAEIRDVAAIRARALRDLELSNRTYHCLISACLVDVGDVADYGRVKLLNISGFGRRALKEVEEVFAHIGVRLKP